MLPSMRAGALGFPVAEGAPCGDQTDSNGLSMSDIAKNHRVHLSIRFLPYLAISGIARDRQIFLASTFDISVCLGIASTDPVRGFIQSE
jgi:hypothetical protein